MNINCNVIIFSYPRGSGGKCIINCLGLSTSATIMCHESANHSTEQKSKYFTEKFRNTLQHGRWNDLGLTSTKFVGNSLDLIDSFKPEELEKYYWDLHFHDAFKNLLSGTKDVFLVAHSGSATKVLQNCYTNSRLVRLVNTHEVVYKRANYVDIVPQHVHKALCKETENDLGDFIPWDCKWFDEQNTFLQHIENLYDQFGYTDFETALPYIERYYKHWTNILRVLG